MIRKMVFGSVVALIALAATTGSALAFECYTANRSDTGNANAAKGALATPREYLADPELIGLCPAGVDHVIAGLEGAGFDTDVLISTNAVMAGGLERNGKGEVILHNGKGVDHLSEEFLEAADALIGEAFGFC